MAVVSACPDVSLLQQLALGKMPPAEVENLATHCEQCPRCIQILHTLKADDTLIEAMACQSTTPNRACDAAINSLIERLKQMPSPVSAEAEGTGTVGVGVTPSADAPPPAPLEKTLASDITLAPPQAADEIGRLGGYRVLKVLGAGGMGMVYQAEDVQLQRRIALKVMKPDVAKNPTARKRFLREARAAAKLKSDHVVNIYQVGEEQQIAFLAMEFLEGMSLEDWLKKGRKPTLAQAARIGRQIALGLADAHGCGLIHRDIKPGNIWLDSRHQGRVKLLDFGLARGDAEDLHLTQTGAIVGTPAYMAPEQARGDSIDHRCDLFSLGVVLYRLTTGRLPFWGVNTMSVLMSLATTTPTPPRQVNADIPPRMAALIERLLSKDREQRPATAKAVADELAIIEREAAQPTAEERTVQTEPQLANRQRQLPGGASTRQLTLPVRRWMIAASLLLAGMAAAIVVIIRDKDGKKVAEIAVPEGGSAEIKDDAKGKIEATRQHQLPGAPIAAAPLTAIRPGEPLSPIALVRQPAKLPGVRSWSIETREAWNPASIAYRPDGRRLAVGGWDGVVRIWEPQSGRLLQVLLAQAGVRSLAWSPDGRVLATGTGAMKRPLQLWHADSGRSLGALETPVADFLFAVAWSADGRKVRAWGDAGNCCTWEAAEGKLLHAPSIICQWPAFSPDGQRLAGTVDGKRILIWDADSGKEVSRLTAPAVVYRLAWSPDGKRLAWTGKDGLHVWDGETRKETFHHHKPVGIANPPLWSPDGRSVAYDKENNDGAEVIEVSAGAEPRRMESGACGAWSPDGKTIAQINGWPFVLLYDVAARKRLRTLTEGRPLEGFAWSPDQKTLAVSERYDLFLTSADSGRVFAELTGAIWPLAWSPDGKRLASAGTENAVWLWQPDGKKRIALADHKATVRSLAWSPDGKRLAWTAAGEKRVLLWNADKGERERELGPFAAETDQVKWSADGRLLTFNVADVGWHVWDMEKNRLVNDPKQWKVLWLDPTPNGRSILAAPSATEDYRLRDLAGGKDGARLPRRPALYLDHPRWSPDGKVLAISLPFGIELWRADLSKLLRTLPVVGGLSQVVFSRDGKLVAGHSGERLFIWEADIGRLRGVLMLGQRNNGLALTADGHYTGNERVERGIVMVVQKDDGTQELLEPADFEQKYGFKNDPNKVHLLQPLPPPLYPLPGMPMGPKALVREPAAELSDAGSWTIETVNTRGQVKAVAYRPDGKLLATGGDDGTIRIWDTTDGKLVRMLVGDAVESLSWSKDGKVLTAGGPGGGEARQWEADTGRLLARLVETAKPATTTARSPDGKQTATADIHGVRLHDAASGKRTHTLEESLRHGAIWSLNWSPDGRRLALGAGFQQDSGLHVVEAATGRRQMADLSNYERAGAWSPDGKTFATDGRDNGMYLLDAVHGSVVQKLEGTADGANALAWSADGKLLAGGGWQSLTLWSVETGKQLWRKDKRTIAIAWSPDGRRLATTDNSPEGAAVRLWEAETGKLLHEAPLHSVGRPAWSPDGKTLVVGPYDQGDGLLIDADSGAIRLHLKEGAAGQLCVCWSSDGKTFTTFANQGLLRVWDAANGEARRTVQLTGVLGGISSASWSPNGQVLAWASGGAIHLHKGDGHPLGVLLPFDIFGQLAVSADGRYRGDARVERQVRMVVQKQDGTSETLTPRDFERKYGFKNDPAKARLMDK